MIKIIKIAIAVGTLFYVLRPFTHDPSMWSSLLGEIFAFVIFYGFPTTWLFVVGSLLFLGMRGKPVREMWIYGWMIIFAIPAAQLIWAYLIFVG
jgi:hypothetical protein